jgi:hypothetical protein
MQHFGNKATKEHVSLRVQILENKSKQCSVLLASDQISDQEKCRIAQKQLNVISRLHSLKGKLEMMEAHQGKHGGGGGGGGCQQDAASRIQRAIRRFRFIKLKGKCEEIDMKLARQDLSETDRAQLSAKRANVVERIKTLGNRGKTSSDESLDRRAMLQEDEACGHDEAGCHGGVRGHRGRHGHGMRGFGKGKGKGHHHGKGKGHHFEMSHSDEEDEWLCVEQEAATRGMGEHRPSFHHGKDKGKGHFHGKGKGKGHFGKGKGKGHFGEPFAAEAHAVGKGHFGEPFAAEAHAVGGAEELPVAYEAAQDLDLELAIALSMEDSDVTDEDAA